MKLFTKGNLRLSILTYKYLYDKQLFARCTVYCIAHLRVSASKSTLSISCNSFIFNSVTLPASRQGMFMRELGNWALMQTITVPSLIVQGKDEGIFLAGPVRHKEEILYAEIDPRQWCGPRWMLNVAGHYARPDVFELIVHTEVRPMLKQEDVREKSEPEGGLRFL